MLIHFFSYGGCTYIEYLNNGKLGLNCDIEKILLINKCLFILTLYKEKIITLNDYDELMELIDDVEILEIH